MSSLTIGPIQSAPRSACDHFRPHAFLKVDKCRDCGFTLGDHTAHVTSPVHQPAYDANAARAALYSNQHCAHFTGHWWLWNRCRDCARSEGVHGSTDGQQPHLTNPYTAWVTYTPAGPLDLSQLTTVEQCEQRIRQCQHEIASVDEDLQRLKQMQHDLLDADKLSQHEYDGRLLALANVHTSKLHDLNVEILAVQQHQQSIIDSQRGAEKLVEEHKEAVVEIDNGDVDIVVSQLITDIISTAVSSAEQPDLIVHTDAEEKTSELSAEELDRLAEAEAQANWQQVPEDEWHIKLADMTIQQLSVRPSFVSRVEKVMQHGRNFVRFTSSQNKGDFISVFIRQLPATSQYTLYWSAANNRTCNTTRSIAFSEIQAIVLGNQASVQQLKRPQFDSVDAHCFSVVGAHSSLHLQAGSEKERDVWAYGLQRLIACKVGENKLLQVQLFTAGQYKESRDRLSIERKGERSETGEPVHEATTVDLQSMQRHDVSKQYIIELNVRGDKLNVASKHHNYIVCLIGRNNKTDQPEYMCQTDRAQADQPFTTPLSLMYEDNVRAGYGQKFRLNVYDVPASADTIEDEYRIGSCTVEQIHLMQPVGVEVPLNLHHKDATKDALLPECTLYVSIGKKTELATSQPFKWPPRVVDKFMDALSFGTAVTLYSSADKLHLVTLFYRVNKALPVSRVPDVGTLYYVPQGRELTEEKKWSLPVHRITDVYRGRRSDNFPEHIDDSCCVSFVIDNGKRLDVLCESMQQRDLWVGGVVNILNAARSYKKRLPL